VLSLVLVSGNFGIGAGFYTRGIFSVFSIVFVVFVGMLVCIYNDKLVVEALSVACGYYLVTVERHSLHSQISRAYCGN
jgi:hypothetical protein